jgi:predicted RNA-binding protein (virulence factor B family)
VLSIGKYNELTVKSKSAVGLYLHDGEESVLLPNRYVPEGVNPGDELKVFVYLDNDNRPVATTLQPHALLNEFAFLTVKDVTRHGAFLDWGIAKDLFVAHQEQRVEMETGKEYLVYVFLDEHSGRIAASSKWGKFIDTNTGDLEEGDEVQLLIAEESGMGFKAVINNRHEGLLYRNEIFQPVHVGDKKTGYVKFIREDGKVDLTLQRQGFKNVLGTRELILDKLRQHNGILALGDKSSPEDISRQLHISKKVFKKTIGTLFKDQLITVRDYEIRLVGPGDLGDVLMCRCVDV